MGENFAFSILVDACHGGAHLSRFMESIALLPHAAEEVELIFAGGSAETESAIARWRHRIRIPIFHAAAKNHGRAARLNAACAHARGSILVFTEDDTEFFAETLPAIKAAFAANQQLGMLGGTDELSSEASSLFDLTLDCSLKSFVATGGYRDGTIQAGSYYPKMHLMAVPAQVLNEAAKEDAAGHGRFFDESLPLFSERDLAERIRKQGRTVALVPTVRVVHYRASSWLSLLRLNIRMGRAARTLRVHRAAHMLLAAAFLAVPSLCCLALWEPRLKCIVAAALLAYLIPIISASVYHACRVRSAGVALLMPLMILLLHCARASGFLLRPYPVGRCNT